MNKWYETRENDNDIVLSTRVRLARNIRDFPFVAHMTTEQKNKLVNDTWNAVSQVKFGENLKFTKIEMDTLTKEQALSLLERHLVSPEFTQCKKGSALLLSADESISIMCNEEDHLRIQVLKNGLDFDRAYVLANQIDDLLDETLRYAFDEQLGFLTQCPTNLGTGLRASVMMHLPMIEQSGLLSRLTNSLSKIGLTIRGTYGEGSKVKGALYQVSNQVTLGISEMETISKLKEIVASIVKQEQELRNQAKHNPHFIDVVQRALGTLRSAYLISSDEAMQLLSHVRLGVSCGMIDTVNIRTLNELINEISSATLSCAGHREAEERDHARASLIQEKLKIRKWSSKEGL